MNHDNVTPLARRRALGCALLAVGLVAALLHAYGARIMVADPQLNPEGFLWTRWGWFADGLSAFAALAGTVAGAVILATGAPADG